MPAKVIPLARRRDDAARWSETDRLIERINAIRDELRSLRDEEAELARQFVELDLRVSSGPRKGEPLTRQGRARRLDRLLEVYRRTFDLMAEDSRLCAVLEQIDAASTDGALGADGAEAENEERENG